MQIIDPKLWAPNELNIGAKGGSEMMVQGVIERLDPKFHDKFQIITSRVRELHDDRIRILWCHDTYNDPESQHLLDQELRKRFHKIVFCNNYQMNQYQNYLGVPHDQQSCVIETAITPFGPIKNSNPKDEIRLYYASTPQRGLSLLVPVFEELCKKYDNITLDVFSSFKIYNWDNADNQFEELFDRCRNHPKINYHGFQPNDVVRDASANAHIFAYPSIWPEQNSRSLIEAMSAGCVCVHPNLAGLADTSGGLTMQYQWDHDQTVHANLFYAVLDNAIDNLQKYDMMSYLTLQKAYVDYRNNWDRIAAQWNALCESLLQEYSNKSTAIPAPTFTYRTS